MVERLLSEVKRWVHYGTQAARITCINSILWSLEAMSWSLKFKRPKIKGDILRKHRVQTPQCADTRTISYISLKGPTMVRQDLDLSPGWDLTSLCGGSAILVMCPPWARTRQKSLNRPTTARVCGGPTAHLYQEGPRSGSCSDICTPRNQHPDAEMDSKFSGRFQSQLDLPLSARSSQRSGSRFHVLNLVDGRIAGHLGAAVSLKTLSIHVCICPHFGI